MRKKVAHVRAVEAVLEKTSSFFTEDAENTGSVASSGTRKFHAEAAAEKIQESLGDLEAILKKIGEPKREVKSALKELKTVASEYKKLHKILYSENQESAPQPEPSGPMTIKRVPT